VKGIIVGGVIWLAVGASIPYGAGAFAGLVLGATATYLIWRMDAIARSLRQLERGGSQPTAIPEPSEWMAQRAAVPLIVPPPATSNLPPAPMPAPPAAASLSTTVEAVAAAEAPARPPLIAMEDLEAFLAGRLLAVVGGIALIVGGVFFLGLAFSRGWIGPEARVVLGLVAGMAFYGTGVWLLLRPGNRAREILGHVVVAVGLAVTTLALFAATRLYGFIAPELGVGVSLFAAAITAVIAIRASSQLVAGFGLVAVLAAPPVMGAGATLLTILFLGAALAGTTAICLFVSWRWLPATAFLLTVPQLASYVAGDPRLAIGLAAVGVFWTLNALSAAGEEVRRPSQQLSPTSATLIVATAAFSVWAGFMLLSGSLEPWRGLYLVGVAGAHLALGSFFLVRNGERHPFGMLVFGSGVAALTLAVPVQLGASWVPMAWAAEAVALAWVYARREHIYAGGAAAVLGSLALAHLLAREYPLRDFLSAPAAGAVPFINVNGAALAFVMLAAAGAIYLLHRTGERVAVAGVVASVIALVLPHELPGPSLIGGYAVLTGGALLVERRWLQIGIALETAEESSARDQMMPLAERALYASAALTAVLGLGFAIGRHLPLNLFAAHLGAFAFARRPFFDDGTLVTAIVAATALVVAFAAGSRAFRWVGSVAAAVAVAYLVPFELGAAWGVVAWVGLGLALHAVATRWEVGRMARVVVTYAFGIAALIETLAVVAPPDRLVVRMTVFREAALVNSGTIGVAALVIALAGRALLAPRDRDARIAGLAAGAGGVYLLSIGTVDLFQASLGGSIAFEELYKQAQVALSVLWAVLGVVGFVIGLLRPSMTARLFGLGLLGIVTVKVFLIDLAALDVAYRVLSFVALGLLLLGAAYLASRFRPERSSEPPRRS